MRLQASPLTFWMASVALTGAMACAAKTPPPPVPFAAIQRDEARLARGSALIDTGQSCAALQAGADTVCDARRDLCERVRDSADRDAQARCLRASDMCASARARADAKCAAGERRAGP